MDWGRVACGPGRRGLALCQMREQGGPLCLGLKGNKLYLLNLHILMSHYIIPILWMMELKPKEQNE